MAANEAASSVDWLKPKFAGKSFHFAGKFDRYTPRDRETLERVVTTLGGTLSEKLDASISFLVVTTATGSSSHEQKVVKLNAKGASIRVLEPGAILPQLIPSEEEFFALILSGEPGRKILTERFSFREYPALRSLRFQSPKTSLRGLNLDGVPFRGIDLEDVDLRETSVTRREDGLIGFGFGNLVRVQLDGADLCVKFSFVTDCSCRKARLDGSMVRGGSSHKTNLTGDFSEASLVRMRIDGALLSKANFCKVDLSQASIEESVAIGTQFDGAAFRGAKFSASKFNDSSFVKADFSNSVIAECDFGKCDFTQANFTGAILTNVSLENANLTGADFTNAVLVGVKLDGSYQSEVKQLNVLSPRKIGPALTALSHVAKQADRFSTSIFLKSPRGEMLLDVDAGSWRGIVASWRTDDVSQQTSEKSVADAIAGMATTWANSTPLLFSIACEGEKTGETKKRLAELALAAWCEAFDVPVPTEKERKALQAEGAAFTAQLRDRVVADLRADDRNVRWKKRSDAELARVIPLEKADLSGLNLSDIDFRNLEFVECDFTKSSFAKTKDYAQTLYAKFTRCNFAGADFSAAHLRSARFHECSFHAAKFANAELAGLPNCSLIEADFTNAKLDQGNLRGTNLTKSNLGTSGASLKKTEFDEHTVFPQGFVIPDSMTWKGSGVDPRQKAVVAAIQSAGKMDIAQFMTLLEASVDKDRVKKATSMLKAERFRLFAQAVDDHLVGVVKSQSDPDLVYSCRLNKEGEYSCCTQNLNVCGGLRGALCKHLLVLIIGMTNGGELDPNVVNQWIMASRFKKPALDKDAMSETLLRYKGAEAGEVDWRPMETIPEDYYAL